MWYVWMQSFRAENQRKTALLLFLFPVFLMIAFWLVFSFFFVDSSGIENKLVQWRNIAIKIFPIIIIVLLIWWTISFLLQKNIMFVLSGAKPLTRKENPELYNIVENLCISRWLPMPKIAIMNEPWMNAFATWWRQKDSWIAFTSWLLQNLDKREIEAVAGHELTRIMNKDSLLMYVAFVFVGSVTLIWEFLFRSWLYSSSSNSKNSWRWRWVVVILWLLFLLLGYLVYPLLKLAISRKREYLADLWSVQLTGDSHAMISALRKISTNSYVAKANDKIWSFFIAEPNLSVSDMNLDEIWLWNYATTKKDGKSTTSIFDSHPSIDDRIAKLQQYWWI